MSIFYHTLAIDGKFYQFLPTFPSSFSKVSFQMCRESKKKKTHGCVERIRNLLELNELYFIRNKKKSTIRVSDFRKIICFRGNRNSIQKLNL